MMGFTMRTLRRHMQERQDVPEQLAHQLAEVDPLFGDEVEG